MKKIFGLLMILAFVVGMASCKATATPTEAPQPTTAAQPTTVAQPTEPPEAEAITLKLTDTYTEGAAFEGMENLIKMFTEKYPNITIERETMPAQDMQTIMKTALGSGTGPDILYYDTGPASAGVLARAGLLLPLDDYYAQYNWDGHIFEWTKARTNFDGKVYGIGNELEFYGAYYNMDLFSELGLSVPETYEDLLDLCQKSQDAGYIPIAFADGDQWPAFHQFSLVVNNLIGSDGINDILHGEGRWDTPEIIKAIQLYFIDMNEAGCFIPNTAAVSYSDGTSLFYSGQALMHLTGTWLIGDIEENVQDFEVGWFFFPAIDGNPIFPPAGLGSGYFVSSATQHPQEATMFLDFLFSEENAHFWLEELGTVPPIEVDVNSMNLTPLMKFAVEALQTQEMGLSIDVLVPFNFQTVMLDGFQAVLLGEKTAEQQAADLQKAWEEAKAAGDVLQ